MLLGVLACVLASLLLFIPWRSISKYQHYRLMRPDIRALAERYEFGRSMVLVSGKRHPDFDSAIVYNPLDLSAIVYNPLDLEADRTVYAWDATSEVRERVVRQLRRSQHLARRWHHDHRRGIPGARLTAHG